MTELRKLVLHNKEILIALRTNFDKPEVMKELFKRLQNVDSVLQRMTIIGKITVMWIRIRIILASRIRINDADPDGKISAKIKGKLAYKSTKLP